VTGDKRKNGQARELSRLLLTASRRAVAPAGELDPYRGVEERPKPEVDEDGDELDEQTDDELEPEEKP
jgi:hypothetical protein